MEVLLTGASGFLGSIIRKSLCENIFTLSRELSDYRCNLQSEVPDFRRRFELIIHAAGKAHSIPKTEVEAKSFFDVNVKGTKNLLDGLEKVNSLKSFVFISSVAVYGIDKGERISEEADLSARDPYGLSKIEAEKLVQEWCYKNHIICTILRLPLIAGPNPPGNLRAMTRGIKRGYYFNIAGGRTRKSMVLAEDVAKVIPIVAETGGIFNLTDGYHPSFAEISRLIARQLGKTGPGSMPYSLAKAMALLGDIGGKRFPLNSIKLNKIVSDLTFDDSKARRLIEWIPTPVLDGFKIA